MRRLMKEGDKKKLLFWIAIFLLIIPFVYTMYYSLPSTDDFWMVAGVDKSNVFAESIETANTFYMNWGGGWIYIFLEVLLNPLVYFGINGHYLGIEMILFLCLFLIALFFMTKTYMRQILKITDEKYFMITYFLILVLFFNTAVYTEIFYWFVGSTYLLSMILILWTVKLEFDFFSTETPSWGRILFISVIGFCACMRYVEAVFPGLIFLVFFFDRVRQKRWKIRQVIPFVSWVTGGIIAVAAPGNYVRYSETSGGSQFSLIRIAIGAVKNATTMTINGVFDLFKNPVFIIVMICFMVLGVYIYDRVEISAHPGIAFIVTLLGLWITFFPFALGYGNNRYIPNRCCFIFNLYAVLSLAVCFFHLGCWMKEKKSCKIDKKQLQVIAVSLAIFGYICLIPTKYYQELPYAQVVSQSHQVKVVHAEWKQVLNYIASLDETEVVFERQRMNTPIIKSPGITGDPENSINQNVAAYFGKESIAIIWW